MAEAGALQGHVALVDGLPVFARVGARNAERPEAPAVVLVHGLVVSSIYMVPTAERLAPHCRVYAPDLPGFGKSGDPAHVLTIPGLASALLRWMDALGLERPFLVGNSLGCQVIAELAVRYPHRLRGAVLAGPTIDPHARRALVQIARFLADAPREKPSLVVKHVADWFRAGVPRALGTFRHALEDRIEGKLPRMTAPTLVVAGTRDPIAPPRWCREAAGLLPRGHLAVIQGAPHALNYSSAAPFSRLVLDFVEQTPA
jgi:2-hydroxy-6-oxonona-2,4-dienedioate hydrolase